jgi:hypothetical protein
MFLISHVNAKFSHEDVYEFIVTKIFDSNFWETKIS